MPTALAAYALELEALVSRAARVGRLDPYELLDTYVALAPSSHPDLGSPRRIDLVALTAALAGLPAALVDARRVLVVPRLEAFGHRPVPSPTFAAGVLADGTLLVEARFGLASLLTLTSHLCVIAHELDKARALCPPAEEDFAEAEDLVQLGRGGLARPAAAPADGEPDAAEPEPGSAGELAFSLGVDEASIDEADRASGGLLRRILEPTWELPPIALHTDFDASAVRRRSEARAERIVASLAEMGLRGRRVHLWVGAPIVTDCVSPYTRELRDTLLAWAEGHPDRIGDVDLGRAVGEDVLYALAADFLASDARLLDERAAADRTVGIQRGEVYDLVDVGRLEPGVCDARLGAFEVAGEAPIVVRIAPDLEDTSGAGLLALVGLLSPRLASITIALEGAALEHRPGTILVPAGALRWAGETLVTVPGALPLTTDDFHGLAEAVVPGGLVLSVPHAALLSKGHVEELARRLGVCALDIGGAAVLGALAEATVAGMVGEGVDVRWALVASRPLASGRPSLDTLAGLASFALAFWRRVLGEPRRTPEPPARERPRQPPSRRTVRLKA